MATPRIAASEYRRPEGVIAEAFLAPQSAGPRAISEMQEPTGMIADAFFDRHRPHDAPAEEVQRDGTRILVPRPGGGVIVLDAATLARTESVVAPPGAWKLATMNDLREIQDIAAQTVGGRNANAQPAGDGQAPALPVA